MTTYYWKICISEM